MDKVPALTIMPDPDCGVRYYGVPSGYEFGTLIKDLKMISKGTTELSEKSHGRLRSVGKPVHIQVTMTPSCPYYPITASLAHQFHSPVFFPSPSA